MESGGPRKPDGQGSRHARRRPRHPAASGRGPEHQHHASVRPVGVRAGCGGVPGGSGSAGPKGLDVSHIASVASFFVSRIDTLVDSKIEGLLKTARGAAKDLLTSIEGKIAIANAKLTYKKYQELFGGARWKALAAKGAQTQRLLWASTSTKNPKYRDVLYVEELIGADTVDTIPPATFDAFRDHGKLRNSLTEDVAGAAKIMDDLEKAGISMKEVTDKLLVDGVKLFADAFTQLLDAHGQDRRRAVALTGN